MEIKEQLLTEYLIRNSHNEKSAHDYVNKHGYDNAIKYLSIWNRAKWGVVTRHIDMAEEMYLKYGHIGLPTFTADDGEEYIKVCQGAGKCCVCAVEDVDKSRLYFEMTTRFRLEAECAKAEDEQEAEGWRRAIQGYEESGCSGRG